MFGFVKYGGILVVDTWQELEFPLDNVIKAVLSVKKYDQEQNKAVKTDQYEYIYGVENIEVIYRNVLSGDALWYTAAEIKVFGTSVAEFTAFGLNRDDQIQEKVQSFLWGATNQFWYLCWDNLEKG